MLRVTLVDIIEGCEVDVDALLLYHFGGSGAGICVWTLAVDRGKTGRARQECNVVSSWKDLSLLKHTSRRRLVSDVKVWGGRTH